MPFSYHRQIYFRDTDAAGVVFFANILAICHEAYEASLVGAGINLREFFRNPELAIPIVHTQADFRRPLFCGDGVEILLMPELINDTEFKIQYTILPESSGPDAGGRSPLATALSRHVAIHPGKRHRVNLPEAMLNWLVHVQDAAKTPPDRGIHPA